MAIIKNTTEVFFEGAIIELIAGNEIQDQSPLVKAKPELFESAGTKPAKKIKKEVKIKIEDEVQEPKEELLVEAPVAALEVTEVTEVSEVPEVTEPAEEPKEEEKPKRRKRK